MMQIITLNSFLLNCFRILFNLAFNLFENHFKNFIEIICRPLHKIKQPLLHNHAKPKHRTTFYALKRFRERADFGVFHSRQYVIVYRARRKHNKKPFLLKIDPCTYQQPNAERRGKGLQNFFGACE